jgi:phosphoserine phosphatase
MSYVLTLVAARDACTLTDSAVTRVKEALRGTLPATWLSPAEAAELTLFEKPDLAVARAALGGVQVDVLATRSRGRRRAVLVADMDSTIVTSETLDELAAVAGIGDQVAAITRQSMNGEIDFREALRARVAMLNGLRLAALEETWSSVQLTPGAKTLVATMRKHGALTALVSGGFTFFTSRVATLCGFDHHRANVLLDDGHALTGAVAEPILGQDTKLATLHELAATRGAKITATLAVGDGANDLAMLHAAGLGVAYHAKTVVAAAIENRIDHADLRALLFAQGYTTAALVED